MNSPKFRFVALSVVQHDYVPIGMAAHPRFEPVVVTDDPDQPDRVHQRNQKFAQQFNIPYIRDVERAMSDFDVQVAVVCSEAERHCDLSVRAGRAICATVQAAIDSGRSGRPIDVTQIQVITPAKLWRLVWCPANTFTQMRAPLRGSARRAAGRNPRRAFPGWSRDAGRRTPQCRLIPVEQGAFAFQPRSGPRGGASGHSRLAGTQNRSCLCEGICGTPH